MNTKEWIARDEFYKLDVCPKLNAPLYIKILDHGNPQTKDIIRMHLIAILVEWTLIKSVDPWYAYFNKDAMPKKFIFQPQKKTESPI